MGWGWGEAALRRPCFLRQAASQVEMGLGQRARIGDGVTLAYSPHRPAWANVPSTAAAFCSSFSTLVGFTIAGEARVSPAGC